MQTLGKTSRHLRSRLVTLYNDTLIGFIVCIEPVSAVVADKPEPAGANPAAGMDPGTGGMM